MQIEGRKNLEFMKRALLSHLGNCSTEALRADDKKTQEVWDPEIKETKRMLEAVEINLEQFREEQPPRPAATPPSGGEIQTQK